VARRCGAGFLQVQAFSSRSCCVVPSTVQPGAAAGVHRAPWGRILPRRRAAALSGWRRTGCRAHVVVELEIAMDKYSSGITTLYPYSRHKNNYIGSPIYIGGYKFTPYPIPMWA
jgi:hypothetical protein